MQTDQYRKSRIGEMNRKKIIKYTKSLAKNQVCALIYMRDIRKNILPKFISFVWRRHVGVQDQKKWVGRPTHFLREKPWGRGWLVSL